MYPFGILGNRLAAGCAYSPGRKKQRGTGNDCYRNFHRHDSGTSAGTCHRTVHELADDIRLYRIVRTPHSAAVDGCISKDSEHASHDLAQTAVSVPEQGIGSYLPVHVADRHRSLHGLQLHRAFSGTDGRIEDLITGVLVVIGLSGIAESVLFSRGISRSPRQFFYFTSGGMTVSLLLLRPSTSFAATVILFCFFWGIAYMVFNLMLQFEIIRFAPQATTIAMAIYSGILNLGIGCGTMVGGVVCSSLSIAYIGYAGGIIGILAWRYCSIKMLQIL
ncbi:MFS transporter [Phocaeicola dorei]|nr:hypothetical protein [Phocaeicola dorei]